MTIPFLPTWYEIRIGAVLDERRARWFEDLAVYPQPNGETVLRGPVRDQSALYGLISRLRDLGIPLISVRAVAPPDSPEAYP